MAIASPVFSAGHRGFFMFPWFKRSTNRPQKQPQPSLFEPLEDRRLLSAVASAVMHNDLKIAASSTTDVVGYTPAQLLKAYGFDDVSISGGAPATGAGQTIAIVDAFNDPNLASDLKVFDSEFGLAAVNLKVVNQSGGSNLPSADAGWAGEIALDVEWTHAIAPAANILLVETNSDATSDLMVGVNYARHVAGVSVVSMSWGGSEFESFPGSGESQTQLNYDADFTTPTGHVGITYVAAAGDDGSRNGIEWPASSSNVISVGGTTLTLADNTGTYGSETGWSDTSGGYSTVEAEPAYQLAVQSTGARSGPDVAYDADPNTGVAVYDSIPDDGYVGWQSVGGTSAGAPQWAALVALADQGRNAVGEGTLDGATQTLPALYDLYAAPGTSAYSSLYTADFNDIDSGGSSGFHGRFGRNGPPGSSATAGYDTVTGLGTPKAGAIVTALVGKAAATSSGGSATPALVTTSPISGVFKGVIPKSAIAGERGFVKLKLTNTSPLNFNGPVKITLYASTDGTLSSDDTAAVTATIAHLRLHAGSSTVVRVNFVYPSALSGSYYFIASITAAATSDPAITAVTATPTSIAQPNVDLAATFNDGSAITVKPGHKGVAVIKIHNLGNVIARGVLNLALYASTDATLDSSDTLLNAIKNRKIAIGPGKAITLRIRFTAPLDWVGGSYDLIGALTSSTSIADGNPSNDIAVIPTA
jgi:hypothetical protein